MYSSHSQENGIQNLSQQPEANKVRPYDFVNNNRVECQMAFRFISPKHDIQNHHHAKADCKGKS